MIKFITKVINVFEGMLMIPIPPNTSLELITKALKDGKALRVQIDTPKKLRSLEANNYMWVVCQAIAEEMSKNGPLIKKEAVYRQAIKDLFQPVSVAIPNEDVPYMKSEWERKGVGWICEVVGISTLYNHSRVEFYKGSSKFDSKEMSRLIEGLVQDAQALGLDVMTEDERQRLYGDWEKIRQKEGD